MCSARSTPHLVGRPQPSLCGDRYDEAARHGLIPIYGIVRTIARVSRLRFFSTEVAMDVRGRFVVVDYVNEICDMRLRSVHADGCPMPSSRGSPIGSPRMPEGPSSPSAQRRRSE